MATPSRHSSSRHSTRLSGSLGARSDLGSSVTAGFDQMLRDNRGRLDQHWEALLGPADSGDGVAALRWQAGGKAAQTAQTTGYATGQTSPGPAGGISTEPPSPGAVTGGAGRGRMGDSTAGAAGSMAGRTDRGGGSRLVPFSPLKRSGEYTSAARVWDAQRSEAAKALTRRIGEGWTYEIVSVSREGDEFLVLGRLAFALPGPARPGPALPSAAPQSIVSQSIASQNIVKSQFGRGAIPGSGAAGTSGTAGGVSFRLGSGRSGARADLSQSPGQSPEDRGYRRAIEDALARCVAML